jgi:hypothetical protein
MTGNLDSKYLVGLSKPVVDTLIQLGKKCPVNHIYSIFTGNCIFIESSNAKKVIEQLKKGIKFP